MLSAEELKAKSDMCLEFQMFKGRTIPELRDILRNILNSKLRSVSTISVELALQQHPKVKSCQWRFLNRTDLLELIYGLIAPEIEMIDTSPIYKLEGLKKQNWTCPQLVDRISYRILKGY